MSPEIDARLANGPEMVSANFVIPYPPGFPILVPGQVIAADTIGFMRKLDVKEIHGYNASRGLKLIRLAAIGRHQRSKDGAHDRSQLSQSRTPGSTKPERTT
jgi:arginine decarboxylase